MRIIRYFLLCIWAWLLSTTALQAATPLPVNSRLLSDMQTAYCQHDKTVCQYVAKLEEMAQQHIDDILIVTDKKKLAPSNDPRDYITLSPYWWPDTTKTDGKPYLRRDGQRNPEVYQYDNREQGGKMAHQVALYSLLYYITGKEYYAQACAQQLRAWFTSPKTGMNPNMTYAQLIPGHNTLRGTGIMDARHFASAILYSQLIEDSKVWTTNDRQALHDWTAAFCYWLEHSTQGQKEAQADNNHGLWYDATHIMLLAYLGREKDIRMAITHHVMAKLNTQIASDGSLPQELTRTLSLHYSTYALEALQTIAHVASAYDINLWQLKNSHGKGMTDILDYLTPYYLNPDSWPYRQIKPFSTQRAAILFYESGISCQNRDYIQKAKKIGIKKNTKQLIYIPYYLLMKK